MAFRGAPPTGPSPLDAADASAVAEPEGKLRPRPPRVIRPHHFKIGVAVAVGLIVVIAIIATATRGSKSSTPTPEKPTGSAGVAGGDTSHGGGAVDDQVARITELLAAGNTDAALERVRAARKVFPKDARLAYLAGKIDFDRDWWTVGLEEFREVLAIDPTYRADPELIKTVLRAFIASGDYREDLATFLRVDIGPPAREYLEETARDHPRAATRARAQAELDRM